MESKSTPLSSCKSRLYPVGSPFNTVSKDTRLPVSRPDFPRTSSATSGFRFWGIRLDPVLNPSDSRTNPNSLDPNRTKSSANRDK